ncbi:MAG: hypothetical protein RL732_1584 [Bacteroidota bacterium]
MVCRPTCRSITSDPNGKKPKNKSINSKLLWTLLLTIAVPFQLFAAEVFFQDVYKGLNGPYAEESSAISISAASKIIGTNFSFTSLNPADARFSGNNVPGIFKYTDQNGNVISIRGVVSRPEKSGSTFRAVYFYASDDANQPLGDAYLFVFPGNEAVFAPGGDIGTSSDPVENALNSLLDSQPPPAGAITVSASALNNFSTCQGSASATQSFTVSGTGLTAGITVTAPAGYEISLNSTTGFATTLSLPLPTGGNAIAATTVYARLTSAASNGVSGNIVCSSTGVTDKNVATGTAAVNPLPAATAGSNSPLIVGGTLNLTASGGASYSWSGPNGFSSTQQNPTVSNITTADAGTYTVTVTSAAACTATAQTIVAVSQPVINTTNTTFQNFVTCAGTPSLTQNFSVGGSNMTSGITVTAPAGYELSLDTLSGFAASVSVALPSGTSTVPNTTVWVRLKANATNGASGNITCTASNAADVNITTGTATVNALPTATASASAYPTAGSTLTLSATGGTAYQWTGPNNFTSSVQNPTIANVTNANAGTYTVKVTNSSNCSATAQVAVVLYPDNDGDKLADEIDLDDDNDGILDVVENAACTPSSATCDTDGDGIINAFDPDSDNDGVSDVYEAGGFDRDCDGKADGPTDVNGVPTSANGGLTVPDDDNDGRKNAYETDSNNDGIPDGEVVLVYKSAGETKLLPNGTYNMSFTIRLKNNRNKAVNNIQLKDNLSQTFKSPATFTVTGFSVSGSSLEKNNSYNGSSNIDLLNSTSTLSANGTDSIVISVNVDPKGLSGSQNNTATVTATAGCQTLTRESIDLSRSGGNRHGAGVPTQFNLKPVDVFIADVLTPNNDGYNDRWYIVFPSTKQLNVTVYNRWGQEVYKNGNYNNEWDGKGTGNFLGKDLPNGTYFYLVEISDRTGGSGREVRKGSLTLKRSN